MKLYLQSRLKGNNAAKKTNIHMLLFACFYFEAQSTKMDAMQSAIIISTDGRIVE